MLDIKALQLASRFALPPNSLGYCGKNTAPEKFKRCAVSGVCGGVEEEISKFIVLYPYLKTLSQITKLPVCSHKVIEGYWFGNEQLKKVGLKHYKILLENFKKQGVPDWLIDELKEKKPNKFIPNHLFQILHVGVGRASGSVPYNLDSINNCMIRWGKVTRVTGAKMKIELRSLMSSPAHTSLRHSDPAQPEKNLPARSAFSLADAGGDPSGRTPQDDGISESGKYKLTIKQEMLTFSKRFLGNVKVNDTVAVHWNQVVKILTKTEERKLSYWTKEVLKSIS